MAKADKSKNTTLKKATKSAASKSRTPTAQKKKPAAGTKVKAVRGKAAVSAKSAVKKPAASKTRVVTKTPTASKARAVSPKRSAKKAAPPRPASKTVSTPKAAPAAGSGRKLASADELRAMLLERRNGIMKNFDGDINTSTESKYHDTVGDMADIAQEASENELTFHLAEVESRELMQIDIALERISEGTYGVCEKCGENISVARLKALPFAGKCIRCQEEDEQEIR